MKTILFSIVLIGLTFCANAQISTNQPARLKTKVTCYEGKIDSGVDTRSVDLASDNTYPGYVGGDDNTTLGAEHSLKWSFVGRNGSKDIYRFTFTRMTKKGSSSLTTDSKEIQFDGKQIIVFEDELHTVVMESPSTEDLKKAQGH
ncbi:MAG TPA: hypothetical protein VE344_11745 [Methylomirabilota bacterium]|nr:hypothetical protein [Methylomirabilota bacterium]